MNNPWPARDKTLSCRNPRCTSVVLTEGTDCHACRTAMADQWDMAWRRRNGIRESTRRVNEP